MLTSRKVTMVAGGLLLVILLCIAGAVTIGKWWQQATSCEDNSPPLKWVDIRITRSQQSQLIEQVRRFAKKNQFSFGIVYYTPNHEEFLLDLKRKDTEILVSNVPSDLDFYHATFHNNDCFDPTVASDLNGLSMDLQSFLSEIPGAAITVKK